QKQKKLIMLPSETMIWQPEFTDKTLSRKPGAVQKASLSSVPDTYRYHLSHRIRRVVGNENTSLPYQQVAREVKAPRERLKYALEAGLLVTALDGLFWSGSQRIAADVLRLRQSGMPVVTTTVEVHDNLTGTTRKIPAYHL
ncbi:MAG: hypothetical protein E6Z00_22600, partial [Escherichia coli]|nr:hypothetical protein [Escherichia coli]